MPEVVQLVVKTDEDGWKRRLALQLASELPEKPADALAVIGLMEELVKAFWPLGGA